MDSRIATGLILEALVDEACIIVTIDDQHVVDEYVGRRVTAFPIGADVPLEGTIVRASKWEFVFKPDGKGLVKCNWKKLVKML
jgi:hypothetical protein